MSRHERSTNMEERLVLRADEADSMDERSGSSKQKMVDQSSVYKNTSYDISAVQIQTQHSQYRQDFLNMIESRSSKLLGSLQSVTESPEIACQILDRFHCLARPRRHLQPSMRPIIVMSPNRIISRLLQLTRVLNTNIS